MYSSYRIVFDGAGSWSFGNHFARNVVIFAVDNSSSSHSDNRKNNFLILDEGDTFGINGSFGAPATISRKQANLGRTDICFKVIFDH